jgi:AraC family transcriptional regulator of adaptative response/methylated-DNA-[protein]-cysteine methyltransferase
MYETIRYAIGQSSLGPFIAAVSDKGLVLFEFGDAHAALVEILRRRFPEAAFVVDTESLSPTVATLAALVDHPERNADIPLDIRGTDYQKRVWEILRRVPTGQTTSYGAVAAELGTRDARDATKAIAANVIAILIPCHRVIRKDGTISGYRWGVRRKRALLSREETAPVAT